ncbi:tyrosine-type recombinase/integrase [Pseudarthrobacter sp. NPDC058329]|uniref:tyrosine-type recombinase/integrase n=1 Tax=Pseudarthrobacter sp. NPDC058329 TaxID=3346448 RepID=UPI0036D9B948
MATFRSFQVIMPSELRYWTVLDPAYRVVVEADDFLLHHRLGRDGAESTSQSYAASLALFFDWAASIRKPWRESGPYLGRFVYWLQHYRPEQMIPGRTEVVRGPRRVNAILAAVRSFFRHAAAVGQLDPQVLGVVYDSFDSYAVNVAGHGAHAPRTRARHRLSEPHSPVVNAEGEDVMGLLGAARSARDRFIVIAMWRMGLRRGELTGLRRSDVHFVPEASRLGCGFRGTHLHVVRRMNPNGAWAKSRRPRVVPADWLTVQAYDQYIAERDRIDPGGRSDFLLVNLFANPMGTPMRPGGINELLARLSSRAHLSRPVHPHMLRHSFATNIAKHGGTADVLKELLGHAWISSSEVYLHPSPERLRAVVDRVPAPRKDGESRELHEQRQPFPRRSSGAEQRVGCAACRSATGLSGSGWLEGRRANPGAPEGPSFARHPAVFTPGLQHQCPQSWP